MIVEYVRYTIAEDDRIAFEYAYRQAQAILHRSPICLRSELCRSVARPTRYVVRIEWRNADNRLDGLRADPVFRDFFGWVRPFEAHIVEMCCYEVIGDGEIV